MKPKEILALEKNYDIQLEKTDSKEDILCFNRSNLYLLNSKGKVMGLNLSNNKIDAIKGFEAFTELRFLNLHKNSIETLVGLEKQELLEVLYLSENKIAKIKELDNHSLRILDLRNNQITKIKGLEQLGNLEQLFLTQNHIKEMEGLKNNKKLEVLDLSFNHLAGIDFLSLSNMNLKKLDVRNNWINTIENILEGKEIEHINLKYNQIEDVDVVKTMVGFNKLNFMNVEGNPFLEKIDLQLYGYGYEDHLEELEAFFNSQC